MSAPAPMSGNASSIKVLNWADYFSPELLDGFYEDTGIRVDETYIERNDEFVSRIAAGERYDVIMPTDWAAEALIKADLLQPLDFDRIPNWSNVTQPRFKAPPYDSGASGVKYTSVCHFGIEGFAVRLDAIPAPRRSWQMLYDPELSGHISMLDGIREVLAPALFLLHGDPNATDEIIIKEATAMALAQRPLVAVYDSADPVRRLVEGIWVVNCWDGDAASAISRGVPGVQFILPAEGYTVWADAPCIPANAENPAGAHRLLNYILEPRVAARNADLLGYQPVVPAAEPLIRSLVLRSLRPTEAQVNKGVFMRDLGSATAAYERAYEDVLGTQLSASPTS